MKSKNKISIDKNGLADGENFALEMFQIKSEMKLMGIKSIWAFFTLDYPKYSYDTFQAKLAGRATDKDFVSKLRSVYERQKK